MRRPIFLTKVKVAIAALTVAASIGGVMWLRPDRIEGRPIAFWLDAVQKGNDPRPTEVLTNAGSEWIPQLCRYAAGQPGFLERSARNVVSGRVPWLDSWLNRQSDQRTAASQSALKALAENPAWTNHIPEVLRASCRGAALIDDGARYFGVFSGRVSGRSRLPDTPETVNALTEAAASRSPWVQYYSICALGRIGPSASNALPVIKDRLHARGRTVAQHAAHALWRISGERREPLRVLVSGLNSPERDVLQWTRQYLVA
ncbi:MAG TPA: hypothetical protein PLX89_27970, partial [Verrucomicrobiota bacterium]|nr:hypothetical protein [Verrucomicrobiota bacterium]